MLSSDHSSYYDDFSQHTIPEETQNFTVSLVYHVHFIMSFVHLYECIKFSLFLTRVIHNWRILSSLPTFIFWTQQLSIPMVLSSVMTVGFVYLFEPE